MTASFRTTPVDEVAAGRPAIEPPGARVWPWVVAAVVLLLTGALAHLWYLIDDCPLDLSGDEAHYWEWSRRLDISYYSKGPLVAWIIAASRWLLADWSQRVVGNEMLAVRVPALVLGVLTGLGMFTLAQRCLRDPRLAFASAALPFTIPILAVGSTLMTIDAPLACLYAWMLVALEAALRTGRTRAWVAVGVLTAAGILAKYTMVLVVPTLVLATLIEPSYRRVYRSGGLYLAGAIAALGLAPILIWNAQHDWVSFRHVAGQAGLAGLADTAAAGSGWPGVGDIYWLGPLEMLGGQVAVVGPVWFLALLVAEGALFRRPEPHADEKHTPATVRLLLAATVTPWLVFGGFSFLTKVQPNWPVLALLPGAAVLVAWLARLLRDVRRDRRRLARGIVVAGVALGGLTVVVMHRTDWLLPVFGWLSRNEPEWNLTPAARYDPSVRLRGWAELGANVGQVLERERAGGREPFLVSDDYQLASQLAFYTPGQPRVYCIQAALGKRRSQYDLWRPNPIADPNAFVGRPCIYVGVPVPELTGEQEPALVEVYYREPPGRENRLRVWPVYTIRSFAGLPDSLRAGRAKY